MEWTQIINETNGKLVGEVPRYTGPEIAEIVDTAFAAQPRWERVPLFERAQILSRFCDLLDQNRDKLAESMSAEMGKHISQSRAEAAYSSEIGRANIEVGKHLYGQVLCDNSEGYENHQLIVKHEALGVVAAVIPFNYPLELTMQKIVPALLMGNAFICKASSTAAHCVKLLVDLAFEAGVPHDVLFYITASRDDCTKYLLTNHKVACIALTGGHAAGSEVMRCAAPDIKKVILELGGNDPLIVTEECADDPELLVKAVEALGWGRVIENNGQACSSPKRLLVHRRAKDAFVKCLLKFIEGLKHGDALDPEVQLTYLVTEKAAKRVEEQIQHTIEQGATLLCGGKRDGRKVEVTILDNVTKDMDIAKDMEVFGPVIPIITFDTDEEALEIANQSSYGLSSGVFTRDLNKAFFYGQGIESSGVYINGSSAIRHNDQPFGGCKSTGIGNEGASTSCAEYTRLKTIGFCDVAPKERLYEHEDGLGDFLDFGKYLDGVKSLAKELTAK